jgi:hypothetical protein
VTKNLKDSEEGESLAFKGISRLDLQSKLLGLLTD